MHDREEPAMEKRALTQYPIHDFIAQRWSPRAFLDKPVEPEKVGSLLEAARWAPSSYNGQPWRFIVATKDDPLEYERLLACLVEFNQRWAKQAPVLVLSVAKKHFERNDKPNAHARHDVGLASMNLVVQAAALGLHTHGMAGFDADKARATYQIPLEFEPVAAWAIGYRGDPATLPEALREKEVEARKRKPLAEIVFSGKWEQAAAFAQGKR
jgi:nitroreductase